MGSDRNSTAAHLPPRSFDLSAVSSMHSAVAVRFKLVRKVWWHATLATKMLLRPFTGKTKVLNHQTNRCTVCTWDRF